MDIFIQQVINGGHDRRGCSAPAPRLTHPRAG
jgi:hypothetical protein